MTTRQALKTLIAFQKWRKGEKDGIPMVAPWVITPALDIAIDELKKIVNVKNK